MSKMERQKRRMRLKTHKSKMVSKEAKKMLKQLRRKARRYLEKVPMELILDFIKQLPPFNSQPQLLDLYLKTEDGFRKIWLKTDWSMIREAVLKQQNEIYRLTNDGEDVLQLQMQLINSPFAKMLAVRRVAHDNQGKKTGGADGIKSLNSTQKFKLAASLQVDGQSGPIRRVWIPKPGTNEQRPLGIPNMGDRAKQALVKLALEPQWEAKFEPTSYGFRPARQAHDAVWQLWNSLHRAPKWVLDADLEKCFDRIHHEWIIKKLNFPSGSILEQQVRAWLRAGILEEGNPFPIESERGTPQGGVISPLLANIALDGMMEAAVKAVAKNHGKYVTKYLHIVRYADDFVVLGQEEKHINSAKAGIEEWLIQVGLNIKAAKTKTLYTGEKGKSFDFLGFTFKNIKVGKHKQRKINRDAKTKYTLSIVPSTKSVKNHFNKVKQTTNKCSSSYQVVTKLSPIIRGWVNYISIGNARTMGKVGQWNTRLFKILSNWQKKSYGSRKRISDLWMTVRGNKWRFYCMDKNRQPKLLYWYDQGSYSTKAYVPVKGDASPYNGDTAYWAKRSPSLARAGDLHAAVLKKQKFKCTVCKKDFFYTEDILYHMDHTVRKASGGSNQLKNLQAIHKWCHESKTSVENSGKKGKGLKALGGQPKRTSP